MNQHESNDPRGPERARKLLAKQNRLTRNLMVCIGVLAIAVIVVLVQRGAFG